ncbi:MAG: hypothetical protein GX864_03300, partial [Mollicutes bacterium]|nr:hypothetical protein [Mollicutes bacterium]
TKTTSVTLNISGSGSPSQMCVSNTTSCSAWQAYTTSRSWTLTSGDGTKRVYIWFRDAAGNQSATSSSDTIILDTVNPTCSTSVSGTLGNSGWYTSNVTISATGFDATSGVASVSGAQTISSDTKSATRTFTVTDNSGRTGSCSRTVKRDATPPNCNPTKTNLYTTSGVTIQVNADDATSGLQQVYGAYLNQKSNYSEPIYDKAGNSRWCSISVYSRTEYQSSNCLTCDRCSDAGCYSYSSWATKSTSRVAGCTPSTSTYYRYTCTLISTNYSTCYYGYGISSPCYTRAYQTRNCATYNRSCALCGCASWNAYSAWTTTVCYPSSSMRCKTQKTYY